MCISIKTKFQHIIVIGFVVKLDFTFWISWWDFDKKKKKKKKFLVEYNLQTNQRIIFV